MALLAIATPGAHAESANNRAETRMVDAINKVRAEHRVDALRTSRSLTGSAGRFSRWLMRNDSFRHLSSIQASSRFSTLGEALATHSGRRFAVGRTLRSWMGSPAHRALILSPVMPWVGVGVTRGRMGSSPATVWVLHVGRLHPTGVNVPNPALPLP